MATGCSATLSMRHDVQPPSISQRPELSGFWQGSDSDLPGWPPQSLG